MVVGHGEVLQPVLYGLAVEQALGRPVSQSRLFFSTVTGAYASRSVSLGEIERRHGLEVLEIIDRALETGVIVPAPRPGACASCDFGVVCGPWEETRVLRKDKTKLADLQVLRRMP
jgi:CRISPR/Cas system-associated exonuclease Cas4 (RecB family)